MEKFSLYIDGKFVETADCFESINPATEKAWASIARAKQSEVGQAVSAAKRAFDSGCWSGLSAGERAKFLYQIADALERHAPMLAAIETKDTGKIIRETSNQIAYIAEYYRYYAGLADKAEGSFVPVDKPDMHVWLAREPVGVVAAIIPWNSQLFLTAVKLAPALAAGCTMVIKASEEAPAPLLAFAKVIDEVDLPAGVVNIITGFADDCGQVLTTHPDIAKIAFTGGVSTARRIVQNSAQNLAQVSLELGGKSPFIVFDDADLDSAVNAQLAAIFAASGQSCVAGSRLLVQSGIKDKFLSQLLARLDGIRIGAPDDMATEYGPLCTQKQIAFIEQVVANSLVQGAKLLVGGKRLNRQGNYYPPTVLDCTAAPQAECVMTELFGPVLSVDVFDSEEEAVAKANQTAFGLASGVFTTNLSRAHRMTKAIRAGVVWVNTYRAISPLVPFGGYGLSGHGRESGKEAMLDYTTVKSVWVRTSDEAIVDPFVMR
ncbi:carnitine dehydratase [Moraxella caviae]|uniref:Betaine aldehyde dehydrogenase n=1 Tax=Moraxella caviae TaxID=34060 RepID=A0A1T0A2U1_9GAMM|nr:aldehyde dehydrogenase [Moraxella caviae]OOR89621.1 carnitine dehydratase [Moraxella caviae]STZ10309.1 Betaine aldehyde dehydrogenase [Moraxella caviae]VEW12649.1 Betaine aldehyde dehydrogenase [Moraxella caviae]